MTRGLALCTTRNAFGTDRALHQLFDTCFTPAPLQYPLRRNLTSSASTALEKTNEPRVNELPDNNQGELSISRYYSLTVAEKGRIFKRKGLASAKSDARVVHGHEIFGAVEKPDENRSHLSIALEQLRNRNRTAYSSWNHLESDDSNIASRPIVVKSRNRSPLWKEETHQLYGRPNADGNVWFGHLKFANERPPMFRLGTDDWRNYGASNLLNYTGRIVLPTSTEVAPIEDLPWMANQVTSGTSKERLDEEIRQFLQYMRPTPAEQTARDFVGREVQDITADALGGHGDLSTAIFGSELNGTALATSDIDIRLYRTDQESSDAVLQLKDRNAFIDPITTLTQRFRETPGYSDVRLVDARYPHVLMLHEKSGITIKIVANNGSGISRDAIHHYLQEHSNLLPVYAVAKVMLDIRNLSTVFLGGIGGYSLFMMVVASMKLRPSVGLSDGLLDFLGFYGQPTINKKAIGIIPPSVHLKLRNKKFGPHLPDRENATVEQIYLNAKSYLSLVDRAAPFLLCLQDPADRFNDLTRQAYSWKHIQTTIRDLYHHLRSRSQQSGYGSSLQLLVGPCYLMYQPRREKLEAFGASLMDQIETDLGFDPKSKNEAKIASEEVNSASSLVE